MSLIKKLNEHNWSGPSSHGMGNPISFADPDHEPGAVEREGRARAEAEGRHFNGTQALLNDVAHHFGAKTRTWEKGHNSWDKQTWAELKLPKIQSKGGKTLSARIAYSPFHEGYYVLSVAPQHLRSEGSFIPNRELGQKLVSLIQHDWLKATGQQLHALDINYPLDDSSRDMYHSSLNVRIGAPSESVPTAKYIKGVQSILDTLETYL